MNKEPDGSCRVVLVSMDDWAKKIVVEAREFGYTDEIKLYDPSSGNVIDKRNGMSWKIVGEEHYYWNDGQNQTKEKAYYEACRDTIPFLKGSYLTKILYYLGF